MTVGKSYTVTNPAWKNADLVVAHEEVPELSLDVQCSRLRDYEVVAVTVEIGGLCGHIFGAGVDGVCASFLQSGFSGLSEEVLACDEVSAIFQSKLRPEICIWCEVSDCRAFRLECEVGGELFKVAGLRQRWRDAVEPDLLVLMSWCRERCAGDALCGETKWWFLWIVVANWLGAFNCFGSW